jgi:hypothetical protein
MRVASGIGAYRVSRVSRMVLTSGAGLLALALAAPAVGMPLLPVPDPGVPSATPASPEVSAPPEVAPATAPDRIDRQWPRNPPWDACPRPVWPGERSAGLPGGGRRVLVIGDSLTRESRTVMAKGMRGDGWTPTFRCWGSRRLDWGIDQVVRSRQLRQLPKHVIIALGTNDISWETPATTERRVRALLDRLGPHRTVLWVDLHLTRSAWLDARAAWFNALLRRLEKQRPNLTVVDWHRVARANGIRGWDGIHYGPFGYRLRAQTVLRALDAAGRRDPVVPAPPAVPTPAPVAPVDPGPAPVPSAEPSPVPSGR